MKTVTVDAALSQLEAVQAFIETELDQKRIPDRARMQIALAAEEIFVNIVHYAYHPQTGTVTVSCSAEGEPLQVILEFTDSGRPFDPLAAPKADVSLSAGERKIGGLGILLAQKSMDQISYVYRDGKNILTLKKNLPVSSPANS